MAKMSPEEKQAMGKNKTERRYISGPHTREQDRKARVYVEGILNRAKRWRRDNYGKNDPHQELLRYAEEELKVRETLRSWLSGTWNWNRRESAEEVYNYHKD